MDDVTLWATPLPEEDIQRFVDAWNRANYYPAGAAMTNSDNMRPDPPGNVYWNMYDTPSVNVSEFVVLALLASPLLREKVKRALNV